MLRSCVTIMLFGLLGCGKQITPSVPPTGDHTSHGGKPAASGDHAGHADMKDKAQPASLVMDAGWGNLKPGDPTMLRFHLERDGKPLSQFDLLHERIMHFIVVRDALDEFQHLHPQVAEDGSASVEITFPTAGNFLVFVDCQPQGETQQTVRHEVQIAGDPPVAPELKVEVPATIVVEDSQAQVTMRRADGEWLVIFTHTDLAGEPLTDLEPYLGAMGHLVVIGSETGEYVHAHAETQSAPDGRVEFAAHFARPGIYKAWGQFQRKGKVFTIPAVLEVE